MGTTNQKLSLTRFSTLRYSLFSSKRITILFFMIGFSKQVQPRDTADITSASLYCEIALLSASSETMTQYHPMSSIQIHCLIFLFYLAIYSIHFLERIKVCLVLNQYNNCLYHSSFVISSPQIVWFHGF